MLRPYIIADWERRAGRVKKKQGWVREARCRAEHRVPGPGRGPGAQRVAFLHRMIDTLVWVSGHERERNGAGWC